MTYKIRPSSVEFVKDIARKEPKPVVYFEVYEEGFDPGLGGMGIARKPERILARNVTKSQAKEILKEILSEG